MANEVTALGQSGTYQVAKDANDNISWYLDNATGEYSFHAPHRVYLTGPEAKVFTLLREGKTVSEIFDLELKVREPETRI